MMNKTKNSYKIIDTIKDFVAMESFGGILLLFSTLLALIIANLDFTSELYKSFWEQELGLTYQNFHATLSAHAWVNDVLMAIFFLSIGLEIKEAMIAGNLSSVKKAAFPIIAAFGGMIIPICIYFVINFGTPYAHGFGIPMATDIAFALGILMLLGRRVPHELKIFLVTLAVVDDLGAIVIIALFYSGGIIISYLLSALALFLLLLLLNKLGVTNILVYLTGGVFLWYFVHNSGIHATIAGVLLAFTIPFHTGERKSLLVRMEHFLNPLSAYFIMPIFAFANAGVVISGGSFEINGVTLGIAIGLIVGKPIGIFLFTFLSEKLGVAKKDDNISWAHIFGAGILGGIGFTMSIFIAILTFENTMLSEAKITIMLSSLMATLIGVLFFKLFLFKRKLS